MKKLFLLILFMNTINTILAESIILDDGKILIRNITKMDVGHIFFKDENGKEEKISNENVIRIIYKDIEKDELQELLTDEEKKRIESNQEGKKKKVEKLKKEKDEENLKKKEISQKKVLEEKKLRKAKKKNELEKSLAEKDDAIKALEESESQKDAIIANLEGQIQKLEEELKETMVLNKSLKKRFSDQSTSLAASKKENIELLDRLSKHKKESIWSVVGRSAVLPGWGHYYVNEKTAGKVYGGLFLGIMLFTVRNYLHVNTTKKEYNETIFLPTREGIAIGYFLAQEKFSAYTQSQASLKQSFSLLSLIYIVQITHAYFSGKKYFAESPIGFKAVDSVYTAGNNSIQNRSYELYYQFRF